MREIVFKAKRKDNGEWVEGFLLKGQRTYIITSDAIDCMVLSVNYAACVELIEVIPETVSMFTGVTNKHNNKIFEGDYWIDKEEGDVFVVEFRDGKFCFAIYGQLCVSTPYGYDEPTGYFGEYDCVSMDYYEIKKIDFEGNIHDNPKVINPYLEDYELNIH